LGFYAELRRECFGGNLSWDFFGVLIGGPRGPTEEGGPLLYILGEFWGTLCDVDGVS
jgi:hypothetical protein